MSDIKHYTRFNKPKTQPPEITGIMKTEQHHKNDCDINQIIARASKTGYTKAHSLAYNDLANIPDYHEAMNAIAKAKENFDAMPSKLRNRFSNDPGKFLNFVQNPENTEEAMKLGIFNKPEEPTVTPEPSTEIPASEPAETEA